MLCEMHALQEFIKGRFYTWNRIIKASLDIIWASLLFFLHCQYLIIIVTTKTISKREAFFWTGKLFLGSWCKFLPCLATCESQNASAEEMTKIHTCPFPWMHWNCWLSSNLWLSCIELDCRSECWKVCSEVVEERKTFKTSKSSIPFLKGLHFWKCRHLIELEASMQGRDQGGFRWNQFFTFYNHTSDHREREFLGD